MDPFAACCAQIPIMGPAATSLTTSHWIHATGSPHISQTNFSPLQKWSSARNDGKKYGLSFIRFYPLD